MKNILVIGSTGMLGFAVSSYFKFRGYIVKEISKNEFDIAIEPINKLEQYFDNIDLVINCAGVIKPTILNYTLENVLKINSIFPRNLAKLSQKKGIKCIHITTDCVFSGRKGKYTEDDFFDADDLYGLSKNAGENKDCMVLRTSIIGEEKNRKRSLLEWAKSEKGKNVNGFINHFWNGVTTLYLAEVIENILEKNLYQKEIFHIYSPNILSKFELLSIINRIYNLGLIILPTEAKESIDRSLASIYDLSSKVCTKTIEKQIEEMYYFFKKINN